MGVTPRASRCYGPCICVGRDARRAAPSRSREALAVDGALRRELRFAVRRERFDVDAGDLAGRRVDGDALDVVVLHVVQERPVVDAVLRGRRARRCLPEQHDREDQPDDHPRDPARAGRRRTRWRTRARRTAGRFRRAPLIFRAWTHVRRLPAPDRSGGLALVVHATATACRFRFRVRARDPLHPSIDREPLLGRVTR